MKILVPIISVRNIFRWEFESDCRIYVWNYFLNATACLVGRVAQSL